VAAAVCESVVAHSGGVRIGTKSNNSSDGRSAECEGMRGKELKIELMIWVGLGSGIGVVATHVYARSWKGALRG